MPKRSVYILSSQLLFYLYCCLPVVAQSTCSASSPCTEGCCSIYGNCGYGPAFCGAGNCTSTCTAQSECNPGGWPAKNYQYSICPLNVCCSQYGFCGTTTSFCGTETVQEPSCSGTSSTGRTIGYYEGWAVTRNCDNMYPEEINAAAFTHLNYAFALIDPVTFSVAPMSLSDTNLYPRFTHLKSLNVGLKTFISIGGWTMNDPDQPTAATFSNLAASPSAQKAFFTSLLSFMSTYGFDGVDIDWEYPVAPERSGNVADYVNYVSFLKNLKAALTASGHDYGLSITIPASYWYLQNFDIVNIEPIVDWFNMMTYDLHGVWDSTDVWIGAIVQAHTNLTEIDSAMQLLWRNGINPANVNMGLGFYGRSFTLANPTCTAAGCPFTSGGNPGPCTQTAGVLSDSEIVDIIATEGATVVTDAVAAVEIATWGGNQWVSYDSVATFRQKIEWANSHCLGGTFVWAVSLDSSNGTAAGSLSQSTTRIALSEDDFSLSSQTDVIGKTPGGCVITMCSTTPSCPKGKSAVQQTNGNPQNVIVPGCPAGQTRTYCCNSNDLPTCHWIGSARLCVNDQCADDEIELATDRSNCWFNHKSLCCSKTLYQIEQGRCAWESGCTLSGSCSDGSKPLYTSEVLGGNGGGRCWLGSNKYCCPNPPPYFDCSESTGFFAPFYCSGSCSGSQIELFKDPGSCLGGSTSFCCSLVIAPDDPTVTAFTTFVNAFKAAPICTVSDITEPAFATLISGFNNDNFRRSVGELDPHLLSAFVSRDLKKAGGLEFIDMIVLAMLGQSQYAETFKTIWNNILGAIYNFSWEDFITLFDIFPLYDPIGLAYSVLCNIQDASAALENSEASQEMCQPPDPFVIPQRRSLENKFPEALSSEGPDANFRRRVEEIQLPYIGNEEGYHDLIKRIFSLDPGASATGTGPWPYTGMLMRAVIDGNIPLLYIRQLFYTHGLNNMPEVNLEVVFDLTDEPGLRQNDNDVFAVFHFHVGSLNSEGLPQISYFHAFHAQYVTEHYNEWFVEGRNFGNPGDPNYRTAILQCPRILVERQRVQSVWIPGPNGTPAPTPATGTSELIDEFGNWMVAEGILSPSSFVFTEAQMNGRVMMTWDFDLNRWNFNDLDFSSNFGPNGGTALAIMNPMYGWRQEPNGYPPWAPPS